jgi:hypothetical protein
METVDIDALLAAARRSLVAWSQQADHVRAEQADVIATLHHAVSAAEAALASPGLVDLHKQCGGVIGYDAWVDSNGEVCGGPFDNCVCMKCDESDPSDVVQGEPAAD